MNTLCRNSLLVLCVVLWTGCDSGQAPPGPGGAQAGGVQPLDPDAGAQAGPVHAGDLHQPTRRPHAGFLDGNPRGHAAGVRVGDGQQLQFFQGRNVAGGQGQLRAGDGVLQGAHRARPQGGDVSRET